MPASIEKVRRKLAGSDDVILNVLARSQQPPPAEIVSTPERLSLRQPPVANRARYDALLRSPAAASMEVADQRRTRRAAGDMRLP